MRVKVTGSELSPTPKSHARGLGSKLEEGEELPETRPSYFYPNAKLKSLTFFFFFKATPFDGFN